MGLDQEKQTILLTRLKKLTTDNLKAFRDRFDIPVLDKDLEKASLYKICKEFKRI